LKLVRPASVDCKSAGFPHPRGCGLIEAGPVSPAVQGMFYFRILADAASLKPVLLQAECIGLREFPHPRGCGLIEARAGSE